MRNGDIGLMVLLGVGLLLWANPSIASLSFGPAASDQGSGTPDSATPGPADNYSSGSIDMTDPTTQAQISAMLATIRQFESNDDYTILYGGGHFSDFSHHPDIKVPITIGQYAGEYSTAAGAYQINFPTYNQFAPGLGITDFSPASQDALGLAILADTGALDSLASGDIQGAFQLASSRWASLPGSSAGQNPQSLQTALNTFASNGGIIA